MTSFDTALALLRGVHVAALASTFGALLFLTLVAPPALRESGDAAAPARQRLIRLASQSAALALGFGVIWFVLQAGAIAGAASLRETLAALWQVVRDTQFGHLVLLRLFLVQAVLTSLRRPDPPLVIALTLSGVAVALQAGIGHAGAAGGPLGDGLMAAEALHLLAAGAWLGGLLPLRIMVDALPPRAAGTALHDFTPVGLSAVLIIAGSAIVQAWQWIGGIGGMFGTTYGHIATLKLALFLVLLLLALINRFILTNRLQTGTAPATRSHLRFALAVEAGLGALVIIAAAFLASSTPATHEQPIWPFSWRPSLDALSDPFGRELLFNALWPVAVATLLAALAGWLWRRYRWLPIAAFIIAIALAVPELIPLFTVDAYPTSFVTSPTEFAAESIVRGSRLFAANCASCHGANGQGDGPAAKSLPLPPADLTAPHFRAHSEGELFWFISHGIDAPSGAPAMPAFGGSLHSDQIWSLIDYLKAHNAGQSEHTTGRWPEPIPVPQFDAVCADGSAVNLDDMRNRILRIFAATTPPPSAGDDVTTILLSPPGQHAKPAASACATVDPAPWNAFAILLGVSPDALAGTQILADRNLWLRARLQPGDSGDWNQPNALAPILRDIEAHPLAAPSGGHHHH